MMRFLAVVLLLLAVPAEAAPYSNWMNAEVGGVCGQFCSGSGLSQCANPGQNGWQCIYPTGATSFVGTYTHKRPHGETLITVVCDNVVVYAGERLYGTSDLVVSGIKPVVGACYFTWGTTNPYNEQGDLEVQFVFH